MKVTERYTMTDADHINYEATVTDPATFTRPWKMSMPLYRRVEKNAQLGQFKCVEFVTELIVRASAEGAESNENRRPDTHRRSPRARRR